MILLHRNVLILKSVVNNKSNGTGIRIINSNSHEITISCKTNLKSASTNFID